VQLPNYLSCLSLHFYLLDTMSDCCDYTAEEAVEHEADSQQPEHFVYEEDEHPPIGDHAELDVIDLPEDEAVKEEGITYVTTLFQEGPLGVNLHRRPADGIVTVIEIVANSQAVNLDIKVGDEIWAIGTNEIGHKFLDRETWTSLVDNIKKTVGDIGASQQRPVLLTSMDIRRYLRKMIEQDLYELPVLSYQELTQEINIQPLARVDL